MLEQDERKEDERRKDCKKKYQPLGSNSLELARSQCAGFPVSEQHSVPSKFTGWLTRRPVDEMKLQMRFWHKVKDMSIL